MKLIILDRDGVINHESLDYVKSPEEFHIIPGSLKAIALLKKAGFKVAIATNQSGIARGYYNEATLTMIHHKLQKKLSRLNTSIDQISFCPHDNKANCDCRKPKPGMLLAICEKFSVTPDESLFIGDSERDMLAAQQIGMPFIFVRSGFGAATLEKKPELTQQFKVYDNLLKVIKAIL